VRPDPHLWRASSLPIALWRRRSPRCARGPLYDVRRRAPPCLFSTTSARRCSTWSYGRPLPLLSRRIHTRRRAERCWPDPSAHLPCGRRVVACGGSGGGLVAAATAVWPGGSAGMVGKTGLWTFFQNVCRVSLRETHGKVVNGRLCLAALSGYFFLSCALFDARQTAFAVRAIKSARQRFFTVQLSVVCLLPCVFHARQRLCRAFLFLCRAPTAYGKSAVSVVFGVWIVGLHCTVARLKTYHLPRVAAPILYVCAGSP
jgi:hypothetical protein